MPRASPYASHATKLVVEDKVVKAIPLLWRDVANDGVFSHTRGVDCSPRRHGQKEAIFGGLLVKGIR